jgi:ABC-type Na+ transport system, ATPase component
MGGTGGSGLIVLRSVTKTFNGFTAVENLSFAVGRGEVVGLLGENGAGKTTVPRMIATVLRPTSGSIEIDGLDAIRHAQAVRKRIGILFGGETGLYDRLTARENIAYFGRLYGLPPATLAERIEALAERFGMRAFLDKRVGGFSKGMKQKIAIARSLVHDPDILLLDEPTTGLDVTSANEMRRLIERFRKEGKTVMFSSHIMSEVQRLCDRVLILHKGVLRYNGRVEALYAQHRTNDLDQIMMNIVG